MKLIGYADYPTLGPTHSELNAKKLMSLFGNIASFFPENGIQTKQAVNSAHEIDGPAFISLKSDPDLSASITR